MYCVDVDEKDPDFVSKWLETYTKYETQQQTNDEAFGVWILSHPPYAMDGVLKM